MRTHGQAQAVGGGEQLQNVRGEAARFGAEEKGIARLHLQLVIRACAFGGAGKQPWRFDLLQKILEGPMHLHLRPFVVVEAGAFQFAVVKLEAQWADKMQLCAGIGAEADDIAGVAGNFWLKEHDMQHGSGPGDEGVASVDSAAVPANRCQPSGGWGVDRGG